MPLTLVGLLAIIGIITWLLSTEGAWGAASTLVCVVISGLVAMNFFEPAALYLSAFVPAISIYADFVSLVGIFGLCVIGLREATEYLVPTDIRVQDMLDLVGKWGFAAATGYVTMAILLTALHTAPLPRDFFDFRPETPVFFGLAPDRQWLGFTQYVSEHSLSTKRSPVVDPVTKRPVIDPVTKSPLHMPNVFDGMIRNAGDPQSPHPNVVWASFPIRYAMRRSQIEKGGVVAAGGGTKTVQPVLIPNTGGVPNF